MAGLQVGVANGRGERGGEVEGGLEFGLAGSLSNRSVQIPTSFSEDRIASNKAGFTSSGSYTTMAGGGGDGGEGVTSKASFTSSGTLTSAGGWEGEEGEERGSELSPVAPPEITVEKPGEALSQCSSHQSLNM